MTMIDAHAYNAVIHPYLLRCGRTRYLKGGDR